MTNKVAFTTGTSRIALALADLVDGIRMHPVWIAFGWQDIHQRYQRSVLGPLWITLTMMVTIAGMGPLYAALLGIDASTFIPFLALGLIAWALISNIMLEGCAVFMSADSMIRSVRLPMTTYVMRMVFRNVLIFFHNILAFVPFAIYLHIQPQWSWFMAVPGLFLIVVAAFPVALALGIFCSRFRDMQQIMASIVQLSFFLTPIIWKPELLGSRIAIAHYNPFYIFIELIRGPLSGQVPPVKLYIAAGLLIGALYLVTLPLFIRFRQRIAFWI